MLAVTGNRSLAEDTLPLFTFDGGPLCGTLRGSMDFASARYTLQWVKPGERDVHVMTCMRGTVMLALIHPRGTKKPMVRVDGVLVGPAGISQALAFLHWPMPR